MSSHSEHFRQLVSEAEIKMEEMLSRHYVRFSPGESWRPNINVYESAEALIICVDLAGMSPDAIQVFFQDDALTIQGSRPRPLPDSHEGNLSVHVMEIDAGDFCRRIELAESIDRERVAANYRDGYLWVTIPKKG